MSTLRHQVALIAAVMSTDSLTLLFSTVRKHVALHMSCAFIFEEHKRAECIGLLLSCQQFLLRGFEVQFVLKLLYLGRYSLLISLLVLVQAHFERVMYKCVAHQISKSVFILVQMTIGKLPLLTQFNVYRALISVAMSTDSVAAVGDVALFCYSYFVVLYCQETCDP